MALGRTGEAMIKQKHNGHFRMFCEDCKTEIFECMGTTWSCDFLYLLKWQKSEVFGPCTVRQWCGKCAMKRWIFQQGIEYIKSQIDKTYKMKGLKIYKEDLIG